MPYRSDNLFYYSGDTIDADLLLSKEPFDSDNYVLTKELFIVAHLSSLTKVLSMASWPKLPQPFG